MKTTAKSLNPKSKHNPSAARDYVMFGFLCLFWGSTWISIKIGVATVPPLFFASTRFMAAGALLMILTFATREFKPRYFRLASAALLPSLLMISLNYGLMAWGMTRVPSGLSAVVNLSMVPLSATFVSILAGQNKGTPGRWWGIFLGLLGLCVLFLPQTRVQLNESSFLGILAIAAGASCYGSGSVLLKAKNLDCPPRVLSAIQSLSGGMLLFCASIALEPGIRASSSSLLAPAAFGSWIFLVVIGSVLAFTIYLTLLPRWGASRVTAYAFVCPLIALGEGVFFTGETFSKVEGLATLLLLAATWLSLRER